jgi:pyruvate dehydrogenase E2 component (dihydrolipoamide acetyltransferase)
VPVVRAADRLPVRDLAAETARLVAAARAGSLGPDDVAGATFSVTALGADGVDFFTPILNPPNVAILGIGRIRDGVRWDGDRPVRQQVLTLSLTVDHRVVDGAPGAAFLATVRALLEAPYRLLV